MPLTLTPDRDWRMNATLPGRLQSASGWDLGFLLDATEPEAKPFGRLVAWGPVKRIEVWGQAYESPRNGGTLTTAGEPVFQGTADGRFVAYHARDGRKLWETPVGSGAVAGPSTYEIDGEQYGLIAVGSGGVYGIVQRATDRVTPGRVYTFKVGGSAPMPPTVQAERRPLVQGIAHNKADVEPGTGLYVANCGACHGVPGVNSGGNVPSPGHSRRETLENLPHLVLNGAFLGSGMPNFAGRLDEAQVLQIRAFILGQVDTVRPAAR